MAKINLDAQTRVQDFMNKETVTMLREELDILKAAQKELAILRKRVAGRYTAHKLPPFEHPVYGYNPAWIDTDFNPDGIRECFRTGDGFDWHCSKWNDSAGCYETVQEAQPIRWWFYCTDADKYTP